MKEIWKDIPGYEGLYQVSNLGRVKSIKREVGIKLFNIGWSTRTVPESIRKQILYSNGYLGVVLHKKREKKLGLVHRLVAQAFIPNPENKSEVNHIDGDKANNVVVNLEWCTRTENDRHSRLVLGNICGEAPKRVICVETGKVYHSTGEAARQTGISQSAICCVANHKKRYKTAGGYHWEYADKIVLTR